MCSGGPRTMVATMKAPFNSAVFGLVPVPPMPSGDTLRQSAHGLPTTPEDMSHAQANGLDVQAKIDSGSGQSGCGDGEAAGSTLSTKALISALVALTALGGIAGHAIAGIDYSIRHRRPGSPHS